LKIEKGTSGPSGLGNQASLKIKNLEKYAKSRSLRFRDLSARVTFVTAFGKETVILLSGKL
jgi:hypothetical protein